MAAAMVEPLLTTAASAGEMRPSAPNAIATALGKSTIARLRLTVAMPRSAIARLVELRQSALQEDDVRRLDGDIRPTIERDPDVRHLRERERRSSRHPPSRRRDLRPEACGRCLPCPRAEAHLRRDRRRELCRRLRRPAARRPKGAGPDDDRLREGTGRRRRSRCAARRRWPARQRARHRRRRGRSTHPARGVCRQLRAPPMPESRARASSGDRRRRRAFRSLEQTHHGQFDTTSEPMSACIEGAPARSAARRSA